MPSISCNFRDATGPRRVAAHFRPLELHAPSRTEMRDPQAADTDIRVAEMSRSSTASKQRPYGQCYDSRRAELMRESRSRDASGITHVGARVGARRQCRSRPRATQAALASCTTVATDDMVVRTQLTLRDYRQGPAR